MNAFITPFITTHNRAKLSRPIRSRNPSKIITPSPRAARMCTSTTTNLETFLRAAGDLGTLRFIAISNGAVLETIGRLDYDIKNFTIPNKGDYLTIASVDTTFECHINLSKVSQVTMSTETSKMGGHQLYVIRLLGDSDNIILSILLQWDPSVGPGNYLHGAEATFEKLQQQFVSITLQDCESLYYLPVAQAAQVLGVSRPTISKVLRANGIKRWPYRKLRAEGKIDALRKRREENALLPANFPVLPPLPPPLPHRIPHPANHPRPESSVQQHNHSIRSEPLFKEPESHQIRDDETYILHLLDRPISPQQYEDHTHPLLAMTTEPIWTCNEQLTGEDIPPEDDNDLTESPPSPQQLPKQYMNEQCHPKKRTHTISTVRPAARAVFGAANWSRGVFQQEGQRESFAFLPPMPFGSSLSEDGPLCSTGGNDD